MDPGQEQQGGLLYLQQHDVMREALVVVVWVGDGSPHRDDLLRSLLLLDVVGPQGDVDGAAQRAEWGCGVGSQESQPRSQQGRWQLGQSRAAPEGRWRGQVGPGSCFSLTARSGL